MQSYTQEFYNKARIFSIGAIIALLSKHIVEHLKTIAIRRKFLHKLRHA